MIETGDLTNSGELVEACGRAWTFSHAGPETRAQFSAWLKARARKELADQRRAEVLQGDDYREALAVLGEDLAAGAYNWGSPLDPKGMGSAVRTALAQREGQVRLTQLLLAPRHGEIAPEKVWALLADNPDGVNEALRLCLGLGPSPKAPATTETTTPGEKTTTGAA